MPTFDVVKDIIILVAGIIVVIDLTDIKRSNLVVHIIFSLLGLIAIIQALANLGVLRI